MISVQLRHDSADERRTRDALEWLAERHDLGPWTWTDQMVVDERARPHSHPVLTLNTEHADDADLLLAGYLHEQLHWFEELHAYQRDAALAEVAAAYPAVPSARPNGAGSAASTRLHLLVCHFEHEALRALLGAAPGDTVTNRLARHHYRWVYHQVMQDRLALADLAARHGLVPGQM
jgi:hypothetical protein